MWKRLFPPTIAIVNLFFKDSPGDFRIPFRWDCSIAELIFFFSAAEGPSCVYFVSSSWRVMSTLWVPVW